MTVVFLLGPDKCHIKADNHQSFYNVLSDFFINKNAFSLTTSTWNHPTVQLPGALLIRSQMSTITGLRHVKKLIIGFLWW